MAVALDGHAANTEPIVLSQAGYIFVWFLAGPLRISASVALYGMAVQSYGHGTQRGATCRFAHTGRGVAKRIFPFPSCAELRPLSVAPKIRTLHYRAT